MRRLLLFSYPSAKYSGFKKVKRLHIFILIVDLTGMDKTSTFAITLKFISNQKPNSLIYKNIHTHMALQIVVRCLL